MKTIIISPYTTTDESIRVANLTGSHLKRHGLDAVVDKRQGTMILKTIEEHKADLSVLLNIGKFDGGGIGLYSNGKGHDIAESIKNRISEIQAPHETKQPALHVLQYSPCAAVMLNDHRMDVNVQTMATMLAKGILSYYGIEWRRTVKKGEKNENIHQSK